MNYNKRKFNMDIAAVCGLREAVIADFIRGLQVTSDETTYRHGYFWVKCTQKTITVVVSDGDKGTVINQDPPVGSNLGTGSKVDITINGE